MEQGTTTAEEVTATDRGPRRVYNHDVVFRSLVAFLGGLAGSGILLIYWLLSNQLFLLFGGEGSGGLIVFILLIISTYVGSVLASLLVFSLLHLVDREKYTRITSTLTQVFILVTVVSVAFVPLYIVLYGQQMLTLAGVAHIITVTVLAYITGEITVRNTYTLLGIIAASLALISVLTIVAFAAKIIGQVSWFILLLFPLLWMLMVGFHAVLEMMYSWFYVTYGTDYIRYLEVSREKVAEDTDVTSAEQ